MARHDVSFHRISYRIVSLACAEFLFPFIEEVAEGVIRDAAAGCSVISSSCGILLESLRWDRVTGRCGLTS